MFTVAFWKDATERALKTFAQFFVVLAGAGALNVFTLDWKTNIGLSLGGALLSYATSIVSAEIGVKNSASLVSTDEPNPAPLAKAAPPAPAPKPVTKLQVAKKAPAKKAPAKKTPVKKAPPKK